MKAVGFALAAAITAALAVGGCGDDETDDGGRGGSGAAGASGGEGGSAAGPTSTASTGTLSSSSSSTGAGASGGEGGAGVGGSPEGGAGVGGLPQGGAGGDTNGGAGVGGNSGNEICDNGVDDDGNTNIDCADAACAGAPHCTIPAGWTCSDGWFNEAGDGSPDSYYCDCACGGHDPDCDLPQGALVCNGSDALDGQTCVNDLCTAPTDWTCGGATYNEVGSGAANPNCDCACGAPDPDCADGALPINGCPAGNSCTPEGDCSDIPPGWTCPDGWFDEAGQGSTPYCDCGCGAHDTDCDILPAPQLTCSQDTSPEPGQTCVNDVCTSPTAWTCDPSYYDEVSQGAANPLCDCECGFPDPDCTVDPPLTVDGCASGETCNDQGTCETTIVIPVGWVCTDTFYDDVAHGNSSVYCDCDCGAHDPDCDLPAMDLTGLYCGDSPAMAGQTCDATDVCVP